MIENTNTLSQKDSVELIMELGSSNAKLDAIADIVSHMEYPHDAIRAIKCVLGMFDEEEEKE
jgi:hypothetical protein